MVMRPPGNRFQHCCHGTPCEPQLSNRDAVRRRTRMRRNRGGFPDRAVFVIDKSGVIRYIEVLDSPSDLPDNDELFEVLRQLD